MSEKKTSINWKVAGYAGQGVKNTGELMSKLFTRLGWEVFDFTEYPSLIKGGHNAYQVHADANSSNGTLSKVDFLVCLNKNGLLFHREELTEQSVIICDLSDDKIDLTPLKLKGRVIDVPLFKLATQAGGNRIIANNVVLGVSVYLLGIDLELLNKLIKDIFRDKEEEIVTQNIEAARLGYEYVKKLTKPICLVEKADDPKMSLSGNEAVGLGAISAGIQMYLAYPMSPSTGVLHYLASKATQAGIVVRQAEDEIGAINSAIGASFAGNRVMVGTSGGGFCYMTEALGFSGVAELPLVVLSAMRPGPALGMPTWSSQGDLLFAIYASQDEFPRFVFTPGDMTEIYEVTRKAFEMAERFQTLAIILTDKDLAEGRGVLNIKTETVTNKREGYIDNPVSDKNGFFPRYYPTSSGVSFRTIPGQSNGHHIASSYEHDQYGFTTEDGKVRVEQITKRFRKFEAMTATIEKQVEERSGEEIGLITFGSMKGSVLEARRLLEKSGVKTSFLHLWQAWPFPSIQVQEFIKAHKQVVVLEHNHQGQLASLITSQTGILIKNRFNKYDGRPAYPEEIASFINDLNKKHE